MTERPKHISVCICTFKRPQLLKRLLDELARQETDGSFTYSAVIADNDRDQSARPVVESFGGSAPIRAVYCVEPEQNIARARNKTLEHATGDYIAFIDDDEFPTRGWLAHLLQTCQRTGADGVLGPVKPHFEEAPPNWATKGGFFERPTHETGHRIDLREARTGNVLFDRRILEGATEVFLPQFGKGGEDVEFFSRMMGKGRVFVWCDEAPVYESVPPTRCTRSYLLRRALLRGSNSLKNPVGRLGKIARSVLAVPCYSLVLPFAYLLGQHVGLKYLIKLSDHGGRLLALVGMNPISQRDM